MINYSRIVRTSGDLWVGSTTDWAAVAPIVLPLGVIGVDKTAGIAKLGNGTSAWTALTVLGVGTGLGDLLAANNLSDVGNTATSRTNLGLSPSATRTDYIEYFLNGSVSMRSTVVRSRAASVLSALTSGVMYSTAIYLEAGDSVTNLTFKSVATTSGPTNWWFALYDNATTPALIAQTADQTSTAWGANTVKTLALTGGPYPITTSGIYYASIMVAAGTPPTLLGAGGLVGANGAIVSGQKNIAQTSGSGLTTTAPDTIASSSAAASIPYAIAS